MNKSNTQYKPTKEELSNLYHEKKLSLSKIANQLGLSTSYVQKLMSQYGIPRRSLSEAQYISYKKKPINPSKEKLRKMYIQKRMSIRQIAKHFNVDKDTAKKWLDRKNIKPEMSLSDAVLIILRKTTLPLYLEDLTDKVSELLVKDIEESDIRFAIKNLESKGYDVKEITHGIRRLYTLIRHADYSKGLYRILGNIETPLLMASDLHIGSRGFSELAFNEMLKDIKKHKIKHVMIAGDLLQGRWVHRIEMQDLIMPNISDQIEETINYLKQIPSNIQIHLILGNHEEKIKGWVEVGLDALKVVAMALPNVKYYGHVALLTLNKKYTYMMLHGSGAVTMAVTYKGEKVWRELELKPTILHTGHSHQMGVVYKGIDKWIVISGCLQRTNAWLIQKGWTAKVGYYILKDITDGTIDIVERTPIVY